MIKKIIGKAVKRYRREKMIEESNKAYKRLKKNKELWEIELKERREWDATLMDEIEDE